MTLEPARNPPDKHYKRCVVLLADGSRPDVFADLLKAGELPNLSRECADKGGFKAISSVFPSTTGPAYLPYVTGCYPGTCNVPGIRWFDKHRYATTRFSLDRYRSYVGLETDRINTDFRPEIATMFDLFPRSYNIMNSVCRGVKKAHDLTRHSRIWLLYYGHLTDHWDYVDQQSNRTMHRALKEEFEFIFTVFPGIDEYAHRSHPHQASVIEQYRYVDRAFGEWVDILKADGRYDDTLFMVVSDHGLSKTDKHFEVYEFLQARGHKTFYYPEIQRMGCTAASMISGNGMANVYFNIRHPLGTRVYYETLMKDYGTVMRDLMREEAVDVLACLDLKGRVHFFRDEREGVIEDIGGEFHYSFDGEDPLGLFSAPVVLDSAAALETTIDSHYPDIFAQLAQLFRSPRTGDVVLSAKTGWDFRRRFEVPLHKASHGSLCDEHMRIPCFSNHPLPKAAMRSVDVFPYILSLMGKPIPELIDGRVLDIPQA